MVAEEGVVHAAWPEDVREVRRRGVSRARGDERIAAADEVGTVAHHLGGVQPVELAPSFRADDRCGAHGHLGHEIAERCRQLLGEERERLLCAARRGLRLRIESALLTDTRAGREQTLILLRERAQHLVDRRLAGRPRHELANGREILRDARARRRGARWPGADDALERTQLGSVSLEAALAAWPAAEVSGARRSVLVATAFRNPLSGDAGLEMTPNVSMNPWGSPADLTPTSFTTESQY